LADAWPLHTVLGEIYFRQGRISDAEREWVEVLNAGHRNSRVYLGLARVRWALSMNDSARLLIDKAYQLDPNDPDIENFRSTIRRHSDRLPSTEGVVAEASASHSEAGLTSFQQDPSSPRAGRACTLVSKVNSSDIRMVRMLIDPEHLRGYGLSVAINGEGSTLLLDTGASGILINREIADKAGLAKLGEARIRGIGDRGDMQGYLAMVHSIRVAGLEFQDCMVRVADARSVLGRDGLIGADMFEDFLVDIDFPIETLHLRELPKRPSDTEQQQISRATANAGPDNGPKQDDEATKGVQLGQPATSGLTGRYIAPEMKSYTSVYRFGHDLLVRTKVGDAPVKLFLLDTGSLDNTISPTVAREVTKVYGEPHAVLKGLNGSVSKLYSASKAVLQFGHLRQENQEILAFDLSGVSDDLGTEVSGSLGFTMLRMLDIKIDYRDGLVDFSYDPKRLIHF